MRLNNFIIFKKNSVKDIHELKINSQINTEIIIISFSPYSHLEQYLAPFQSQTLHTERRNTLPD